LYEAGSFYVVDKAYIDFRRFNKIHTQGSFFVTRAKNNMRFKRMYSKTVDKTTGVQSDQIGVLETYYSKEEDLFFESSNGWHYEHVAAFGALHYQTTPKLDARLKSK
jgi:hypothetical protein